ncbi:MAG: hypothetical protein Q9Q13_00805 [Acidobacteriota bacterium]|nr:hypothetical protein [Acidobacteriota bacterium]
MSSPSPCPPTEDSTAPTVTAAPRRPPGRPPRRENRPFGVSYALADDDLLTPLRIPLLAPGSRCEASPPPAEDVECLLALDPRLLGRTSGRDLVALRATESMTRDVACWIGSQDVVVVDRRPSAFDPSRIHAFRQGDDLLLSRACVSGSTLLLLPLPTRVEPPRAIELPDEATLADLLFGTVIWSARNWTA